MVHELKILPQFYEPVYKGLKTFELRNNDRGFQMGDTVILREWIIPNLKESGHYTDAPPLEFIVGYVLPYGADTVVFSLIPKPAPIAPLLPPITNVAAKPKSKVRRIK